MPVYAGLFDDIDKEVEQEQKTKQYKYWWEKAIDSCGNDYDCKERILIKVGKDLEETNFRHLQMLDEMQSINRNIQDISDQQAEFYRQQRLQQQIMYNQNQMMYNQQQMMYNQRQLQNFMSY